MYSAHSLANSRYHKRLPRNIAVWGEAGPGEKHRWGYLVVGSAFRRGGGYGWGR